MADAVPRGYDPGAAFAAADTTPPPLPPAGRTSAQREEVDFAESADVPLLPASDPDSDLPKIKLGETIKFEEMGPVIINADGTTRRIDNWDSMTEREREVAWRRISKRNEERRKVLLDQQQTERQQQDP